MPVRLVDPRNETRPDTAQVAPRLRTLEGSVVALLDISKPGGSVFLDRLAMRLTENFGVARIDRETKPTFAKLAPDALVNRLRGVDAVVLALAD